MTRKVDIFFNESGYYIKGEDMGICKALSPLTDSKGNPIYDDLQHLYRVLLSLLGELMNQKKEYLYHIYNYSRIIDELNGNTPLNEWHQTVCDYINQNLIFRIRGMIWFIKRPIKEIELRINEGKEALFNFDIRQRDEKIREFEESLTRVQRTKRQITTGNFKEKWLRRKKDLRGSNSGDSN